MKEELTREVVEALAKCSGAEYSKCENCPATKICDYTDGNICKRLASALLKEMDKQKHDVWKNAPGWATSAEVTWESATEGKRRTGPTYTRELPKTRARQIAEEVISENVGGVEDKVSLLTDLIETALEKYADELKGEE